MTTLQFVLLLTVNTLIAIGYCVWNLLRKEKKSRGYLVKTLVMLLCPVVGLCYVLGSYLLFRLFFFRDVDLADVVFSKERVKSYMKADEDRERNIVPLEEAIAITDKDNLRQYMMNVVKGDVQKSLASISLALNSEDSETSHYAASVLQETLNNFRTTVQKNYYEIMNGTDEEEKIVRCGIMVEYMNEVLKQNVFSDTEQKKFVADLDNIADCLFMLDSARMTPVQLEAVSMCCLGVKDYEGCEKWCGRSAALYPSTLSSYTCSLKYYFSKGDKERFFQTLEKLKKSDVVIDRETLDLIRVFI